MLKIFIVILILLGMGTYFMISRGEPRQQGNFQIGGAVLSVEIADNFAKQYQGLSGRETLCQACGMLFVYDKPKIQNFVMRGMKFPLDFVFISQGRIVESVESVAPPKSGETPAYINSTTPADMVLEVNAGFVSKNKITTGDEARLDRE